MSEVTHQSSAGRDTYHFERVEIFIRVKGRKPDPKVDKLTQEILDEYVKKFDAEELTEGLVPLKYLHTLIKTKKIKPL